MVHDEGKWHETLQQLRVQFRRGMDGETSAHQRQWGLEYGINFGINLLRLQEMAKSLPHEDEIADLMWSKDVREMKLLSLMIREPVQLTIDTAIKLTDEVNTLELAEQLVFHLLRKVSFAPKLLIELFKKRYSPNSPSALVPYLLLNHLSGTDSISNEHLLIISPMIIEDFSDQDFYLPTIIYNALQRIAFDREDIDITFICREVIKGNNESSIALATDIMSIIEERKA